jgi:DinB superfamily
MKIFLESSDLLQTIATESQKNSEQAQQLAANLSEEQVNWKPSPDRWSVAQCLEHLTVANKEFEPYLTAAIAQGKERWPMSEPVRYKPTLLGGWLARELLPETTRKHSAPKIFRPSEGPIIHDSLQRFLNEQTRILDFVRDAKGFDYNKARLRSPAISLIRYSVADAFVIIVVHCWRHLAQARRVLDAYQTH